jgi:flagellar motor component MotA
MLIIIGAVVVTFSVLVGYVLHGGNLPGSPPSSWSSSALLSAPF